MQEPAQTLVGELERIVSALPDAVLFPGLGRGRAAPVRGRHGRPAAAGPGDVSGGARRRLAGARRAPADVRRGRGAGARRRPRRSSARPRWQAGLWPVAERAGRRYALDAEEASGDGEWPVVEVTERGVDRVGTSFLRFLHVLCAELAAGSAAGDGGDRARRDALPARSRARRSLAGSGRAAGGRRARGRDRRDAGRRAARRDAADAGADAGDRHARRCAPATTRRALRAFKDAIALEPVGARDDDARLDAAALVFVLAAERGDARDARPRRARCWASRPSATAAFWRGEALARAGRGRRRAGAAGRRAGAADRRDARARRSRPAAAAGAVARSCGPGCGGSRKGARRWRRGRPRRPCARRARRWRRRSWPTLGAAQAFLAEALNAARDPGAVAAAQRATEINPTLVDGWRELGDAQLEAGELKEAEAAFRRVVAMDTTYGLGLREAGAGAAGAGAHAGGAGGDRRGGASAAAIRSSSRRFAATSTPRWSATPRRPRRTTRRWRSIPRITGRCTRPRSSTASRGTRAGRRSCSRPRSITIATAATRRWSTTAITCAGMGRIGDAVKLYRRAVAAVPGEHDWKQTLREAERELLAAPN